MKRVAQKEKKERKYRRINSYDRQRIEALYNSGHSVRYIAEALGFHVSGIYYELKHGFYMHRNSNWTETKKYSAYKADRYSKYQQTSKGPDLKIGNDYELIKFIEEKIVNEKMSPDAVIGFIKKNNLKFKTSICTTTLYSYIDKGLFLHITNKHLHNRSKDKQKKNKVRITKRVSKGNSIEQRPESVLTREEFGHWEYDTVIGKKKKGEVAYVFTERKTNMEFIIKGKDKTALSAIFAIDKLERQFGNLFPKVFKSITCDNGTEFSNWRSMETSCIDHTKKRTTVYYCHPYSSYERGSNENQNKFIRRFIPKGTPISDYTSEEILQIQNYINNYPRRKFNYYSSQELFEIELANLQ